MEIFIRLSIFPGYLSACVHYIRYLSAIVGPLSLSQPSEKPTVIPRTELSIKRAHCILIYSWVIPAVFDSTAVFHPSATGQLSLLYAQAKL